MKTIYNRVVVVAACVTATLLFLPTAYGSDSFDQQLDQFRQDIDQLHKVLADEGESYLWPDVEHRLVSYSRTEATEAKHKRFAEAYWRLNEMIEELRFNVDPRDMSASQNRDVIEQLRRLDRIARFNVPAVMAQWHFTEMSRMYSGLLDPDELADLMRRNLEVVKEKLETSRAPEEQELVVIAMCTNEITSRVDECFRHQMALVRSDAPFVVRFAALRRLENHLYHVYEYLPDLIGDLERDISAFLTDLANSSSDGDIRAFALRATKMKPR